MEDRITMKHETTNENGNLRVELIIQTIYINTLLMYVVSVVERPVSSTEAKTSN